MYVYFTTIKKKKKNYLESLVKHRLLDPTTRSTGSTALNWGLRIQLSYKLSGDADVAHPWTVL